MMLGLDEEKEIKSIVSHALAEDVGQGDITSQLLVPDGMVASMLLNAREPLVFCGGFIATYVYGMLGGDVSVQVIAAEGEAVAAGKPLVKMHGSACTLLTGERVALNLMQRMSGIATLTARYVQAVAGTRAVILDTRKTMPGLRILDKYAVRAGGGQNHRMRLDDMVLIKDNHIALCGSIMSAVHQARAGTTLPVVVECDTLEQVEEAIRSSADRIMLDNMDIKTMEKAVGMTAGKVPLEATGGVSLENVAAIARAGVDYISIGRITHSAPAVDIGADITLES